MNINETTVTVTDEFSDFSADIPVNEYDVVLSFFVDLMKSRPAAEQFAGVVFRVAAQMGENALEIVNNLRGKTSDVVLLTISYYMNQLRSRASLVGVAPIRGPNFYAARNVML